MLEEENELAGRVFQLLFFMQVSFISTGLMLQEEAHESLITFNDLLGSKVVSVSDERTF